MDQTKEIPGVRPRPILFKHRPMFPGSLPEWKGGQHMLKAFKPTSESPEQNGKRRSRFDRNSTSPALSSGPQRLQRRCRGRLGHRPGEPVSQVANGPHVEAGCRDSLRPSSIKCKGDGTVLLRETGSDENWFAETTCCALGEASSPFEPLQL